MNVHDIVGINRDEAFPIYTCVYPHQDLASLSGYDPGRIVLSHYDHRTGDVRPDLIDVVGPGDVVFIPLYGGDGAVCLPDRWLAHETSYKLPAYGRNIEIIREIAPRVRAILIGNAGPEMSFKEKLYGSTPLIKISDWACEFIKETAEIVMGAGGKVAYGTVDWDVAIDCYFGQGMVRDLCNDLGAIQICFCGYQLLRLKVNDHDKPVPDPSDKIFWQKCPKNEADPWPELTDYIRGTNDIWSGVCTTVGLERGFDIELEKHGFDAGVMGPPGSSFSALLSSQE